MAEGGRRTDGADCTDMLALKREGSASYEAEIYQNLNKSNRSFGLKKTEITLSYVCGSCQSLCAKCKAFGFESELSHQSHNT